MFPYYCIVMQEEEEEEIVAEPIKCADEKIPFESFFKCVMTYQLHFYLFIVVIIML